MLRQHTQTAQFQVFLFYAADCRQSNMAKLNQRGQWEMPCCFFHWFCRNCFLPVLTARQTARMVENRSDCPQKEVTRKSRQTQPWRNQQPSQATRFFCVMGDQALFAASNACFIFIIHKSKSLGKFKCICDFVKTDEENHFLCLFVLSHTIIRHCMNPIKNVLLYSTIASLYACRFSLHLWHPS